MEKYQEMKKFISAALEYSRHHADSSLSALQRHLQILASSTDLSEFDPVSSVATEFYVSLHELMNGLESRSMLVWSAIAVLQKACMNPSAKKALIHTYKFIPILTRFLGTHHISDKQLRLLQVLVELTYGVKISWQEAHLPYLISTLVQIIFDGDKDLKPYALGVLVNLCYKNLPALYVLMRKVEITKFIKCITKLNDNPNIRMQVCKMLIILEQMKGVLPDIDILNFVDVTFSTVSTAFQSRDVFLLRHIVDFFKDVKENDHFKMVMLKYPKYFNDTRRLVELIERQETTDEASCECVGLLLDFFPSLLNLEVSGLSKLFARLASASLKWVQFDGVSVQALGVIQTVVELAKSHAYFDIKDAIIEQLKLGLPGLLLILDSGGEEPPTSIERRAKLKGLVTLLAEMATYPDLRKEILHSVKYRAVGGLFEAIIKQDPIEDNVFQCDVSELCIQALTLVATLANYNNEWMSLYTRLLNQRHVQVALAVALYTGSKRMKCQVFALANTPGCTKDSINFLCEVMCEMKQITGSPVSVPSAASQVTTLQDIVPLYNCAQESRLNELIAALQDAKENGRIGDASTSAVMELYEYKLAAMGHAERRMQCSLEAADACCVGMNHQIAQYRAEVTRLHQMLFYSQQCIEGMTVEKKDLILKLQESSSVIAQAQKVHAEDTKDKVNKIAELESVIQAKDALLEERAALLAAAATKEEECQGLIKELEHTRQQLVEAHDKQQELIKMNAVTEERLSNSKSLVAECEAKMADMLAENRDLKDSLGEAMQITQHKDSVINNNNKLINDYKKRIEELERIREIVINVVGAKKT